MADRYWVGGSAIWDATAGTKWSATSGGAGGASVPTSVDDVYIDASSGAVTVTATNAAATCRSLSFTSPSGDFTGTFAGPVQITISGSLTLVSSMTRTFTGALVFNATNAQTIRCNGISLDSQITFNGVAGSWTLQDNLTNAAARTVTFTNGSLALGANTLTTGVFSSTNTNVRTLDFGTGKIVVSGNNTTVWNTANVSTLTVAGSRSVELSYSGAAGTRTITASSVGFSEAKVFDFSVTAGTDTVGLGADSRARSFLLSAFAGTLSNGTRTLYGSLLVGPSVTLSAGASVTTFASTSSGNQITTNGKTLDFPLDFNGAAGVWQLADALTIGSTRSITLTNGQLDANGQNVTLGSFALGAGTKTLTLGSGTWTVAGSGTAWNANTNVANLTVSPSVGIISMTSASAKTFAGGAQTWPRLNQGGAGALTIQQSNSFANITNSVQPATITLTAGTTQTVAAFGVSGTAGNLITLNSSTAGTRATLSDSVGTVEVSNVSIQDINATGGATWNAFLKTGNVDAGNNSGWDFFPAVRQVFGQVFSSIFRPIF